MLPHSNELLLELPRVQDKIVYNVLYELKQNLRAKEYFRKPKQWHVMTKESFGKNTEEELMKVYECTGINCNEHAMKEAIKQTHKTDKD